ncbi:uncharacterized protein LOC121868997 isoform X2 [Homarus americanus]|uniref:uncharacterized protein LOC121868997 isoform X2 n=1 Tax=Homarus americanus TaxID=6706 RepID=UPI001C48B50D|nr:uncharacterized protein LOC121868997 isoform X2 [Homarus americanus]
MMVFVNMASHKSLTDDDLRKKLKEYGITSCVTASTRNILIKKLNHVIANQKKTSTAKSRARKASNTSQLNTFSSDEDDDNDSSVCSQASRSSRLFRNRRGLRGNTDTTLNARNESSSGPQVSRTSGRQISEVTQVGRDPNVGRVSVLSRSDACGDPSPTRRTYYPVSARSGISPRAKIHDEYDTGSDSDLADGDDANDTSMRKNQTSYVWNNNQESDVLPNNNSYKANSYQNHTSGISSSHQTRLFNTSDVIARNRKTYLENGEFDDRDCLEDDSSFMGVEESIVSRASPGNHEQVRIANGRHHSESSARLDHSHSDESTWHYSVPLLLLILLAVFFGVVGMIYVNMRMPLLPTLRSVPAMVHQAVVNVPVPFPTSTEPKKQPRRMVLPSHSSSSSSKVPHRTTKAPLPPEPAPSHTPENKFPICSELIKSNCLSVQEMASVQPLMGKLEDVLLPALHRQTGLYQCGDSPLRYIPVAEVETLLHQQDSSQLALNVSYKDEKKVKRTRNVMALEKKVEGLDRLARGESIAPVTCAIGVNKSSSHTVKKSEATIRAGVAGVPLFIITTTSPSTSSSSTMKKPSDSIEAIKVLGRLAEWNSHWGLEAVRGRDKELLGLSLSSQPTYILCHITSAIYSFFYLLVALITVIITAWLAFYCVRYHKRKAEEEKQQVYELIEQILEVLGGIGGPSGKDFVAINHVRDSLIGPRDRRAKKNLWDKAVQFIDHCESRVRREIQAVGGEDCEVWRWASGMPHSPSNSLGGDGGVGRPPTKMWQGPAFDTLGPQYVPNVPPTSCLKIRNMFDCDVEFGDSWPLRIQDSILEKCEGISIVHIAVDRGSREGCVYLKCASLAEVGRAFRALHGWWYDGNLVTVKFLRDERYHQRFPTARHAMRRLRPSNNKRLSLQVPTGQLEASKHT